MPKRAFNNLDRRCLLVSDKATHLHSSHERKIVPQPGGYCACRLRDCGVMYYVDGFLHRHQRSQLVEKGNGTHRRAASVADVQGQAAKLELAFAHQPLEITKPLVVGNSTIAAH